MKNNLIYILLLFILFSCTSENIKKEINLEPNITVNIETKTKSDTSNLEIDLNGLEDDEISVKTYQNIDSGVTLMYPSNITIGEYSKEGLKLDIEISKIEDLDGSMGLDKKTALKNKESLKKNKYGEDIDFQFYGSKKLREIGYVNAQDFFVLSRFDICDIVIERKLYFFNDYYQVILTLSLNKDLVLEDLVKYTTTNEVNCGKTPIWADDGQKDFYWDIVNKRSSEKVLSWYNVFDEIVNELKIELINNHSEGENNYSLLQGKWLSFNDENQIISFIGNKKIDYYMGEELSNSDYGIYDTYPLGKNEKENINGNYIVVDDLGENVGYKILSLGEEELFISLISKGNKFKYTKIK